MYGTNTVAATSIILINMFAGANNAINAKPRTTNDHKKKCNLLILHFLLLTLVAINDMLLIIYELNDAIEIVPNVCFYRRW